MNNGKMKSKTALVLAGGGLIGAVYEIGALRAMEDLLVDRTVNDFDMYVGTSAGAIVGSGLANGISIQNLMDVVDGSAKNFETLGPKDLFRFNVGEFSKRTLQWPRLLWNAWGHYLHHLDDMTLFDILWSLTEGLPSALYDGQALEKYMRKVFKNAGISDKFTDLRNRLFIVATDLDTGNRRVFGEGKDCHVPISRAVAASTALPLLYKPIRIDGKEYVDGGLRGTASLDVAIEQGANLVICINPMVPFDNSSHDMFQFLGQDKGYISEKGMQAITSQISRITLQSGLHYHVKQLKRAYPEVDIILIEPRSDDYQMFFDNVMRYSARRTIAEHGFETVTLGMAEDYRYYEGVLKRHGIKINRSLAMSELVEIKKADYDQQVLRKVLARKEIDDDAGRQTVGRLKRSLAELEIALEQFESA